MIPTDQTSLLRGNLNVLQRQIPTVFRWLAENEASIEGLEERIMTNRLGRLDWRLSSGKGLFDNLTPELAYKDWVPDEKPEMGATVIIGCNLGYGLNRVLSGTGHAHRVWVLEPRPEMLVACLSQTDYRQFLESGRLLFIPPDIEHFKRIIWQLDVEYVFGKVFMLADVPSYQISPLYARWAERCKIVLESFGADLNTLRLNQDRMIQNELRNYPRAMRDGDISPLRDQGKGIHAVVYGAGPSLSRFAPSLAKRPGSALHVCGLQVLPTLYAFGLKPHFCMAIDYTEAMKGVCEGLDKEWAKDIPLIYSRKVSPGVLDTYPGPTLPIWTVGGIGTFLPREREVVLNGGGSVSVALTRFLSWCGIQQFLLVGFDFAWKGEKTHVSGHLSEKATFHFNPKKHVVMKNKHGDPVYSEAAYITALRDLENDLKETSLSVFNLYGDGLRIEGAPEVCWEDMLQRGMLSTNKKHLEYFLRILNGDKPHRIWPRFAARSMQWGEAFRAVKKRIGKLSKMRGNEQEIKSVLRQILLFLKQDPLYQPYLFNEILEIAHMARDNESFGQEQLAQSERILIRVMNKVAEIDQCLDSEDKRAA